MKSTFFLLLCFFLIDLAIGQVPNGFNYQTVARSSGGTIMSNADVQLRISILQGETTRTPVSTELFNVKTNDFGLINLIVGSKDPVAFEGIDWSKGPYFLKVEIDDGNGTNFSFIGTSQLLSVPYALHSKTAQYAPENDPIFSAWDKSSGISILENQISDISHFTNADEKDPVFSNSFSATIKQSDIADWNIKRTETDPFFNASVAKNITLNDLSKWNNKSDFDGKYTSLTNIPSFHKIALTGNFNDLSNLPANIISLSKPPVKGDLLYYDGAKWMTLPIGTSGQILTIDLSGVPVWK